MEEILRLNLAELAINLSDMDHILTKWMENPIPKTAQEIAKEYITAHLQQTEDFIPYDIRGCYSKGQKLLFKINGELRLGVVTKSKRNSHSDDEGISCDKIEVEFIDHTLPSTEYETRRFICNYYGHQYSSIKLKSYQVVGEKEIEDVLPKILIALRQDNRFISFGNEWFPLKLLEDYSDIYDNIRNVLAKSLSPLSAQEILHLIHNIPNGMWDIRKQFSLDYYLNHDSRFVKVLDSTTKWDLRRPLELIRIDIKECIDRKHLKVTPQLESLLYFHGYVTECYFSFPDGTAVQAYYSATESNVRGSGFIEKLINLSEFCSQVLILNDNQRGRPISIVPCSHKENIESEIALRREWIEKGILHLPIRLSQLYENIDSITVIYDGYPHELDYCCKTRYLKGLSAFFTSKQLNEYDYVHLRTEKSDRSLLHISPSWKRNYDRLLQLSPHSLDWENASLCDCIIWTLAKLNEPIHYREIYAEISTKKYASLLAIRSTLSQYSPGIFVAIGNGRWTLCSEMQLQREKSTEITPSNTIQEHPTIDLKSIVNEIMEGDYVYKLLERLKEPLSYKEICIKLSEYMNVSSDLLQTAEFLSTNDPRLYRLDDGTFVLSEWMDYEQSKPSSEIEESTTKEPIVDASRPRDKSILEKRIFLLIFFVIVVLIIILSFILKG